MPDDDPLEQFAVSPLDAAFERTLIWVDPVNLGDPNADPVVVRYPDGSVARGKCAVIWGPAAVVYRPLGYADGKHVAVETLADVDLA